MESTVNLEAVGGCGHVTVTWPLHAYHGRCGYSHVSLVYMSCEIIYMIYSLAVVRLDGSQPVRYGLKLEMDDKYRSLKQSLSDLCGIPGSRLLLVEVYGAMIRV